MGELRNVSSFIPTSLRSPAFLILAVYLALAYASVALPEEIAVALIRENGLFETLGALCFLITSILFWTAYVRSKQALGDGSPEKSFKRISYVLLALLFFFGAGEEISWGQRLFTLPVPEAIREVNVQEELNIHNLRIFYEGENKAGVLHLFHVRRLFNVFWLVVAVMIPFAAHLHIPTSRWLKARIPVGPTVLGLLFLANYIVGRAIWTADPYYVEVVKTIEIEESNFAVLFVFFAIGAVWGHRGEIERKEDHRG